MLRRRASLSARASSAVFRCVMFSWATTIPPDAPDSGTAVMWNQRSPAGPWQGYSAS